MASCHWRKVVETQLVRVVASNTRGPWLKCSYWQMLCWKIENKYSIQKVAFVYPKGLYNIGHYQNGLPRLPQSKKERKSGLNWHICKRLETFITCQFLGSFSLFCLFSNQQKVEMARFEPMESAHPTNCAWIAEWCHTRLWTSVHWVMPWAVSLCLGDDKLFIRPKHNKIQQQMSNFSQSVNGSSLLWSMLKTFFFWGGASIKYSPKPGQVPH